MFKKALRRAMIFVGSLLAIVIILYAIAYFKTEGRINKEYAVSLQPVVVPADSVSYIAGKHIAENRGCIGCHGADLSGGRAFLDEQSPVGILYSANITRGKGGINFTDQDWVRVLRHGVSKQNHSIWFMPSNDIYHISNLEMGRLLCFIKQHPPVDKVVPAKSLKPLGHILVWLDKFPLLPAEKIDHQFIAKDNIQPTVTAEYGAYLATVCKGCHGDNMKGGPSHEPKGPAIPDISSTGEPAKWSTDGFITALRTGKTPAGKTLDDTMPWKFLTFTDNEMKAIQMYLQQVK